MRKNQVDYARSALKARQMEAAGVKVAGTPLGEAAVHHARSEATKKNRRAVTRASRRGNRGNR